MNEEIIIDNSQNSNKKLGFFGHFSSFFKKLMRKFSTSLYEKNYCYLSFAIPVVIIYLTFICLGMFPFGDRSILTLDMDGQYVYFFEQLRDIYTGEASLFYTFERCLGGEFLGYFTYYLSSPLSIIVAIFPKSMITEAIMTMMILKSGLSGLSFSIYLSKTREKNTIGFTMFSTMYALCSYGTMYQFNTMWIDALIFLPLIALGIESLVKDGRFKLFIISLALAICSNYYIGYMLCIFVAIYFFFCICCISNDEINPLNERYHRLKGFVRIAIASIIALIISAAIILSAYYSLSFGKSSYQDNSFEADLRFDVLNLLAKMFLGSFDTVRFAGTPNIYVGLLPLILLPVFYISKKVRPKEKIFFTVLALIFVLSFSINTIDLVWHGFQAPIWFNYRYSFIFSFIILLMAYRGYEEYESLSTQFVGKIVLVLIGLLIIIQKTVTLARFEWVNGGWEQIDVKPGYTMLWLSILFLLAYLLIFFVGNHYPSNKRIIAIAMAALVFVETFANSTINWVGELKDGGCATRENYRTYVDKLGSASAEIIKKDPSFYRMEHTIVRKSNDNLMADINGLSEFTSTFNASTVKFMERLGFYTSEPTINYISSNPVVDTLLGVKYIIGGTKDEDTNGAINGLNSVSSLYNQFTTENELIAYQNPYALSLAYRVDGNFTDKLARLEFFEGSRSPFSYLNNLVCAMLDENTVIFETCFYELNNGYTGGIEYDDDGGISLRNGKEEFTVTAKYSGNIYMYLPSPYTTAAKLTINDDLIYEYFFQGEERRIIDLGYFEKGSEVSVKLEFSSSRIYLWDTENYFVQINEEALKKTASTLKSDSFVIKDYSDTHFNGTLKASKDGVVFTSIPYDSNWQVYVDGERVTTYELVDCMMGFDISGGEHDIELKYVHKPFIVGSIISVVGIGIFVLLCVFEKKYRAYIVNKATAEAAEKCYDKTVANENLSEENNDIPS